MLLCSAENMMSADRILFEFDDGVLDRVAKYVLGIIEDVLVDGIPTCDENRECVAIATT